MYYTIVMKIVLLGKVIKDMKTISKTDRLIVLLLFFVDF